METDKEVTLCPCCGQTTTPIQYKFNQRQVDHYISCVMAGVPYWRSYALFNGAINVTFGHLSTQQGIQLQRKINELIHKLGLDQSDMLASIRYSILRRVAIRSIFLAGTNSQSQVFDCAANMRTLLDQLLQDKRSLVSQSVQDKSQQLLGLLQDPKLFSSVDANLLQRVAAQHNALYQWIMSRSMDENFWAGIKQD